MVDVSAKAETVRVAAAEAGLRMQAGTLAEIFDRGLAKGDAVAGGAGGGHSSRETVRRVDSPLSSVAFEPGVHRL